MPKRPHTATEISEHDDWLGHEEYDEFVDRTQLVDLAKRVAARLGMGDEDRKRLLAALADEGVDKALGLQFDLANMFAWDGLVVAAREDGIWLRIHKRWVNQPVAPAEECASRGAGLARRLGLSEDCVEVQDERPDERPDDQPTDHNTSGRVEDAGDHLCDDLLKALEDCKPSGGDVVRLRQVLWCAGVGEALVLREELRRRIGECGLGVTTDSWGYVQMRLWEDDSTEEDPEEVRAELERTLAELLGLGDDQIIRFD